LAQDIHDPDEYAKRDPKKTATTMLAVRLHFLKMDMDQYRADSGQLASLELLSKVTAAFETRVTFICYNVAIQLLRILIKMTEEKFII